MKTTFGTNIRITIDDESATPAVQVTFDGLPAGVDLEKEDFMDGPGAEEPQFGEGRLLCKDGSFVTDGRPFTITLASGSIAGAFSAAGVMAKHIIAPVRVKNIPGSAGECICSCMPAGLQLERAFNAAGNLYGYECTQGGMNDGVSDGEPLKVRIIPSSKLFPAEDLNRLAEDVTSLAIADSLFF